MDRCGLLKGPAHLDVEMVRPGRFRGCWCKVGREIEVLWRVHLSSIQSNLWLFVLQLDGTQRNFY